MEMDLSGASLQGPVSFLFGAGVQSQTLSFSTNIAFQLGDNETKWEKITTTTAGFYLYILVLENVQEFDPTIKR